jgi:hypothetical protein
MLPLLLVLDGHEACDKRLECVGEVVADEAERFKLRG